MWNKFERSFIWYVMKYTTYRQTLILLVVLFCTFQMDIFHRLPLWLFVHSQGKARIQASGAESGLLHGWLIAGADRYVCLTNFTSISFWHQIPKSLFHTFALVFSWYRSQFFYLSHTNDTKWYKLSWYKHSRWCNLNLHSNNTRPHWTCTMHLWPL